MHPFWDVFVHQVFVTFGSSLWTVPAGGRVLERAHLLHPFAWGSLDPYSLSSVRQSFPAAHPMRVAAEAALQTQGPVIGREDLLLRLATLRRVDERWAQARRGLAAPYTDAALQNFLSRMIRRLVERLMAGHPTPTALAPRVLARQLAWAACNPDRHVPLSRGLFGGLLNVLPQPPAVLANPMPAWYVVGSPDGAILRASLGLTPPARTALYLSLVAGLDVEQIGGVLPLGRTPAATADAIAQAYCDVL